MKDIFEIIEMSQDAERLVLNNSIGKIHSIYKNTINISLGKRIVSIHPNTVIKSPMSLKMGSVDIDLESLDLNIGDNVQISKDILKVGNYIFDFKNAERWNPSLGKINIDFKHKYDKEYKVIKDMLKTYGGENDLKNIILNLIEGTSIEIKEHDYFSAKVDSALEGFILGVKRQDLDRCVESVFNILGLGIGLTPSGDDFIMGLMSILAVSKESDPFISKLLIAIKEMLKTSLDRTTFLSGELYFYALEDKYSSIFLDIFDSIKKKDKDNLFKSIQLLLAMGHSSGTDTLCGIVFAMNLIDKAIKK